MPTVRKHIKSISEKFQLGTETKPVTPVVPTKPTTRPNRPIPTKRPGEKEKTKPMGEFMEVMDTFFDELRKIKDTKKGKKIIKNIHSKYVKGTEL